MLINIKYFLKENIVKCSLNFIGKLKKMRTNQIVKDLPDSKEEFIVSYISLGHTRHSLLAISKKVGEHYYIVNSIGITEVNRQVNFINPNANGQTHRDIRAVHEVINPNKNKTTVYAKHYPISNLTANRILTFISHKRGTRFSFDEFSTNCHNFVLAILENNGIHDNELYTWRLPNKPDDMRCNLERVDIPESLQASQEPDNFLFYGENNRSAFKMEAKKGPNIVEQKPTNTWQWKNIKIERTISYEPETKYYKVIDNTPNIALNESIEKVKIKKAIYLLDDYANGSIFWHPCRNYRVLVREFIKTFKINDDTTVNDLLSMLRDKIDQHHKLNGDVSYVKGDLHSRLIFIDFVLNNPNYTETNIPKNKPIQLNQTVELIKPGYFR